MARKKSVEIELDLQDRDAKRKLKDTANAVGDLEEALDESESAGKKMARAIEAAAGDMIEEIDATASAVQALERALGPDFDADPREVVADLKAIGLTAQDIEADADELATALRKSSDVKVHATEAGFSDLGQAVGSVREDTEKARDTMSGFIGGTVGELPGISEAMGPVSEGLGQLAEGALAGEVNFKQLALAGGAMAGVAVVLKKVQDRFARIAEYKAWETEQVESYSDALRDTDSVLEAVAKKLEDAGELTLQLGEGLFEFDMLPVLNRAGVGIDELSQLIAGGEDAITAYAAAMEAAGVDTDQYAGVVAVARQELGYLEEGQDAAAAATSFFGTETEDAAQAQEDAARRYEETTEALEGQTEALQESIDALEEQADAQLASADAAYAVTLAEYDFADAVADTAEALADGTQGTREHEEAAIELARSAQQVADAKVREAEETANASGSTLTATQRIDTMNASLISQASQLNGPQRQALIDHIAQVNGLPASKATEIAALIAAGDLEAAETALNGASRARQSTVKAEVDQAALNDAENRLNNLARRRGTGLDVRVGVRGRGGYREFAAGTPYTSAGTALVGEEGPEIVDLPPGANVQTARRTAELMRGGASPVGNRLTIVNNWPAGVRPDDVENAQRRYRRLQGPT